MSFSEFYQRSINEPEQFWAEQARRIDWQTPFTQTLDHSNPPFLRKQRKSVPLPSANCMTK